MRRPPPPGSVSIILLSAMTALLAASSVRAIEATLPGEIETEATFACIGLRWWIAGDDNLDCAVTVAYRETYGSDPWRAAQPLLRVEPGSFNQYGIDPGNLLAGSLFGLAADVEYEIRLDLRDPDGGAATETRVVRTRAVPAPAPDARIRYVTPGDGGGSGTIDDPFRGLASADAAAEPGDLFVLQPGAYADSIVFTASGTRERPIVWRGEDRESVLLDGRGIAANVVWISGIEHVHLENVTIMRPRERCVIGFSTVGVVIRRCRLDVTVRSGREQFGIDFRGPGHRDLLISDNTIQGYLDWEDGRWEDAYACIVSGTGHVIRSNEIFDWWDGIHVGADEPQVETSGCDVYRNEIHNCTDDGIETDAARHNVRIFDNRITNCLTGLSAQPVFGGPVYLMRNVVYNWQLKPLKFHEWPTGLVVLHNTLIGADPRGWGGGDWRRTILRNNLVIGGSREGHSGLPICFDTVGLRADLDYDGWYQALPDRFANFNYVAYGSIEAFRDTTGMEMHGLLLDLTALVDAEEPPLGSWLGLEGFFPPYEPGSQDVRLADGSVAIDAGEILPNVNDAFSRAAPDLGAYEHGTAVPHYGPDPEIPVGIAQTDPAAPSALRLEISPSPSRGSTLVTYVIPTRSPVRLTIHDLEGRAIRILGGGAVEAAGPHRVVWDGRDDRGRPVAPAVYLLRIEASGRIAGRPIVLTR